MNQMQDIQRQLQEVMALAAQPGLAGSGRSISSPSESLVQVRHRMISMKHPNGARSNGARSDRLQLSAERIAPAASAAPAFKNPPVPTEEYDAVVPMR